MARKITCLTAVLVVCLGISKYASAERVVWAPQGDVAYFEQNGLIGLVDINGEELVPPTFTSVDPFILGYATVRKGELCGLITREGKMVVELTEWDQVRATFSRVNAEKHESLQYIGRDGKYGYLSLAGKVISVAQWDVGYAFSDGIAEVVLNQKSNLINRSGELLTEQWWRAVKELDDNRSLIGVFSDDKRWGVINRQGEMVIPTVWEALHPYQNILVVKKDEKWGAIDRNGRVVIPIIWDEIIAENDSPLLVAMKDEKYGYIDVAGNTVLPFKWDEAFSFREGLAKVCLDGREGFINLEGELTISLQSISFDNSFNNGICGYSKDRYWGFVDNTGDFLSKVDYELVFDKYGAAQGDDLDLSLVQDRTAKYGFMNARGEMVLPFKWEKATSFHHGLAFVSEGGQRYRVINTMGENITEEIWEKPARFELFGDVWLASVIYESPQGSYEGYIDENGMPVCGIKLPEGN